MNSAVRFVAQLALGLVVWLGSSAATPNNAAAERQTSKPGRILTPRGAEIDVLVSRPVGQGPFPVVVLGSGSSYTMQQPILERVAQALVKSGVGVYRFDWAYHVRDPSQGKPSADRGDEIEDMSTVLTLARSESWTDSARVFLGGKSLGSIIAWQLLRRDPKVAGALLLTPVCSRPNAPSFTPDVNYPEVAAEQRPVQWVLGDVDPVCEPRTLYRFVAGAPRAQRVALVRGNHAFAPSAAEKEPSVATRRVIELVAEVASHFVATATDASFEQPKVP